MSPRTTKADWLTIRRAYVEGRAEDPDSDPTKRVWPTLEELSILHGLHVRTVERRSRDEHWGQQREQFQLDVERQARERNAKERADQIGSIDGRGLRAADAGLAMVGHRLAHLLRNVGTQTPTQRGADLHARELSTLGLAAWRFVRVKDAVLGTLSLVDEPDEATVEREQQLGEEMLAARLALRHAERLADVGDAARLDAGH